MGLPTFAMPTATLDVDGQTVSLRGLTRGEALTIADLGHDAKELETALLSYGADMEREAARLWHASAPAGVVHLIVQKIMELSGLGENASHPTNAG